MLFVELVPYAPGRPAVAAGVGVLATAPKRNGGLGSLSDVVLGVQASLVYASR